MVRIHKPRRAKANRNALKHKKIVSPMKKKSQGGIK